MSHKNVEQNLDGHTHRRKTDKKIHKVKSYKAERTNIKNKLHKVPLSADDEFEHFHFF